MRIVKFNLKNAIALGIFLMVGNWVCAQKYDSTFTMQEVVITGTKFALPVEKSGKTIYKLSAESIAQNAGKSVVDILNEVPGIQMEGNFGSPGTNINYYVRGGRNKSTLVLIDGIPLNDPSGIDASFDLRFLPLSNIEFIEVLKGGLSTLYGTGASAAVINIKLKESKQEGVHGVINYNFGSFNTHGVAANINGSTGAFNYFIGGNFQDSEGFSAASDENATTDFKDDGFNQKNLLVKFGYNFSKKFNLDFNFGYDKFEADYDGGAYTDADNQQLNNQLRIGISPKYTYAKGNIKLNILSNYSGREDVSSFPSEYKSKNLQTEVTNEHQFNDNFKTLIGLNYQKLSAKQILEPEVEYQDFNLVDPFVSIFYENSAGFNIHGGIRLNSHSEYGSEFVYNFNPSYLVDISESLSIKIIGSISTSYITPSLYQLYSIYGNLDLNPEKSLNYEGGLSLNLNKSIILNSTYFRRDEKDPIIFESLYDAAGNWTGGVYNNTVDERVVDGMEFELDWNINAMLDFKANYTYTRTDKGTTFYRIPNTKFGASINVKPLDKFLLSVKYNHTGERTIFDFGSFSEIKLDSYNLIDLYMQYQLIDNKFTVYSGLNNLFDDEFISVYGFKTKGRNFSLGLNYKF